MTTTNTKTLTPAEEKHIKNVEMVYNYVRQHNKEDILDYLEDATQIDISLCSSISITTNIDKNEKGCTAVSMLNSRLIKNDNTPIVRYSSFNNEPQLIFKEKYNACCTINLCFICNFIVLSSAEDSISFCFDYKVNNTTYKYLFTVIC